MERPAFTVVVWWSRITGQATAADARHLEEW